MDDEIDMHIQKQKEKKFLWSIDLIWNIRVATLRRENICMCVCVC